MRNTLPFISVSDFWSWSNILWVWKTHCTILLLYKLYNVFSLDRGLTTRMLWAAAVGQRGSCRLLVVESQGKLPSLGMFTSPVGKSSTYTGLWIQTTFWKMTHYVSKECLVRRGQGKGLTIGKVSREAVSSCHAPNHTNTDTAPKSASEISASWSL